MAVRPSARLLWTAPAVLAILALLAGAMALGAAGAPPTAQPAAPQDPLPYRPPVEPAVLLRGFSLPAQVWSTGHRGVDLTAGPGTPVHAPAAGVVTHARSIVDRGVVTVEHLDGLRSSLEPVDPTVVAGQRVAAGEVLGHVGVGGHCQGCLHWGVRRGRTYLDPLGLLPGVGPVVLLAEVRPVRPPAAWSAGAASRRCASGRCATR